MEIHTARWSIDLQTQTSPMDGSQLECLWTHKDTITIIESYGSQNQSSYLTKCLPRQQFQKEDNRGKEQPQKSTKIGLFHTISVVLRATMMDKLNCGCQKMRSTTKEAAPLYMKYDGLNNQIKSFNKGL